MKTYRTLAFVALFFALISAAWLWGYEKGSRDTADRESDAWEALIASGWLSGYTHRLDRWAESVTHEVAIHAVEDYRKEYEHFVTASEKISSESPADWLMDNHKQSKMRPDELKDLVETYQKRAATKTTK